MPLNLSTAKAAKKMPMHYGHGKKKKAGAKPAAKKTGGKGKLPAAFAKRAEAMKKKSAKKRSSKK